MARSPKSAPHGVPVIEWHGKAVTDAIESSVEARLEMAAITVENEATNRIRAPKSGSAKGVGIWKGVVTRRSAPGEAPAGQSGALVGSIAHGKPRRLKRIVGTNLPYGRFLELGWKARNGKYIAPRPWLEVSLFASINKIKRLFSGGISLSHGSGKGRNG